MFSQEEAAKASNCCSMFISNSGRSVSSLQLQKLLEEVVAMEDGVHETKLDKHVEISTIKMCPYTIATFTSHWHASKAYSVLNAISCPSLSMDSPSHIRLL